MSGGALDYACNEVAEIGERVSRKAKTPLHRAFAAHLDLVAKALHELEWMLSGDTSEGDEVEAIQACIGERAELDQLTVEAKALADYLNDAIGRADAIGELRKIGAVVLEKIDVSQ